MASFPRLFQRIRRARRDPPSQSTAGRFDRYRPRYEEVFAAVESAADEKALEALGDWAVSWTEREQRYPTPAELEARARALLGERDVEIPPELRSST